MILLIGFIQTCCLSHAAGQQSQKPAPSVTDDGMIYEPAEVSYWEFGMKIQSNTNTSGISATVPVPISWPEQTVTVIAELKTDNLRKLSFKSLSKDIRQMLIRAKKLGRGETARASVVLKVEKRNINSPIEIKDLRFADPVPSKLRQYTKPSPYIESNHKRIRKLAEDFTFEESLPPFEQVEEIYRWVRKKIEYDERDEMKTCLESLDSGKGDCFELSSLFIALCRARKIPARSVWIPGHMYPEFYLEDKHGNGLWLPCQAAGSYSFGDMAENKPIVQKGDNFRLPRMKKPVRFVRPQLRADASPPNALQIEFINRRLTTEEAEQAIAASKK